MDNQSYQQPESAIPEQLPPSEQLQPENHKKSKKLFLTVASGVLILLTVLIMIFVFLIKEDDTANSTAEPQNVAVDDSSETNDTPEVREVENRGTFTLLPPSDTFTYYDLKFDENNSFESAMLDMDTFITFKISRDWKVYERPMDKVKQVLGSVLMQSPSGKYIHVDRNDGNMGGTCEPNDLEYKLVRKISTGTPDLFFTEYSYATRSEEYAGLKLEKFLKGYRKTDEHLELKQGESGIDTCTNLAHYSFAAGSIYVTVSDNEVNQLYSNLSWEEIKDDGPFVATLESLTAIGEIPLRFLTGF